MEVLECSDNKTETCLGIIKHVKNFGNHYEALIESRSGLLIIFGETNAGGFCLYIRL